MEMNKPGVNDYDINEAYLKLQKKIGISTKNTEKKNHLNPLKNQ